jgi:hypothetical protein
VLLGGERVDLPQGLTASLKALDLRPQLVHLFVGESFGAFALGEALEDALALTLEARSLDGDRGEPLACLARGPAQLGLARTESAQLLAELRGAASARIHAGPQRRLEAKRALGGCVEQRGYLVRLSGQL